MSLSPFDLIALTTTRATVKGIAMYLEDMHDDIGEREPATPARSAAMAHASAAAKHLRDAHSEIRRLANMLEEMNEAKQS